MIIVNLFGNKLQIKKEVGCRSYNDNETQQDSAGIRCHCICNMPGVSVLCFRGTFPPKRSDIQYTTCPAAERWQPGTRCCWVKRCRSRTSERGTSPERKDGSSQESSHSNSECLWWAGQQVIKSVLAVTCKGVLTQMPTLSSVCIYQ